MLAMHEIKAIRTSYWKGLSVEQIANSAAFLGRVSTDEVRAAIESAPELSIHQYVEATWEPKPGSGKTRTVRGEIVAFTPTRVRIEYVETRGFSWNVRDPWVPRAAVFPAQRPEGFRPAQSIMRDVVSALAGKEAP